MQRNFRAVLAAMPFSLHQLGHGVDAAILAAGDQLGVHPRAAVAGLDLGVDRPDLHEEGVAALLLNAGRAVAPGVVAGRGDLERFAEQTHRPLVAVFLDEAEGHSASLAKNAAAFFRMSRSARRRLFSARRRRFSSSKGETLPRPGKACSPWACESLLPVADEVVVETEGAGGLGDGVALLGDELDGLRLELGSVGASRSSHDGPPRVSIHP